jgi:hypothetical protein
MQKDQYYPWLDVELKPEDERIELNYWLQVRNGKHFVVPISEWEDYLYFLEILIKGVKYWMT